METNEYVYLPEGSICEDCIYCVARIIEPLDLEDSDWEIYVQEDDDDEESVYTHVSCLILDIDLHDHVVRVCNKFDSGNNPFLNNKFLAG